MLLLAAGVALMNPVSGVTKVLQDTEEENAHS
jgi:hypothetical protein